jgi:hypothetical protein
MGEQTSTGFPKRHIYHFSLGDSTEGGIGYCAEIVGTSEEDATARLRRVMTRFWEGIDMNAMLAAESPDGYVDDNEYLRFYVNPDAISVDEIDESYEIEDIDDMGDDDHEDDEDDEDNGGVETVGGSETSEV